MNSDREEVSICVMYMVQAIFLSVFPLPILMPSGEEVVGCASGGDQGHAGKKLYMVL